MKKIFNLLTILTIFVFSIVSVFAIEVSVSNYDPLPAKTGEFVDVWIKVSNNEADEIENIRIEVQGLDGLTLSEGEDSSVDLGSIAQRGFEIRKFKFKVAEDALKGDNRISVKVTATGKASSETEVSISVEEKDVNNVNLEIGDITSEPLRIKPDDENVKLEVLFQNLGEATSEVTKAEITDLPTGFSFSESYSNTALLGNVVGSGTATGIFYIDIDKDVSPGEYEAEVKFSYKYKEDKDDDDFIIEDSTIPIILSVKPVPLYEIVNVSFSPSDLGKGTKEVKMKISIKNVGEKSGESVRLKVFTKTEQPFDFAVTSDFIAPELKPGETGDAVLEFDIKDDANLKDYYLDIEIKNVVDEDVLTSTETVVVPVKEELRQDPAKWMKYLLVLVIVVVVFFLFKKKEIKKQKREEKKPQKITRDDIVKKKK